MSYLGYVEFRFDLGSGKVRLNSTQALVIGKKVRIVAKRYHRDGTLTIDGQPDVTGSSGGDLKSLDLAEHLFLGSIPSDSPRIKENIGFIGGFIGCISKLHIGTQKIDLAHPNSKEIIKIYNVKDCQTAPCSVNRCKNGGTCLPGSLKSFNNFKCSCPIGFNGLQCQLKSSVCQRANPCIKGTTCVLLEVGGFSCKCNVAKSEKLCIECELLFKKESFSDQIYFSPSRSRKSDHCFYWIFISRSSDFSKYCTRFCDRNLVFVSI